MSKKGLTLSQRIESEVLEMNKDLLSAIYGVAIGDALGVPVEFYTRESLMDNPVTEMLVGDMPKGTYSDDTAMTLCNLASFKENNWQLDYHDIMQKFVAWANEGYMACGGIVFDIGNSTRKALQNYYNGLPLDQCGGKGFHNCGNGSLMRIIPVAFYLQRHHEANKFEVVKNVSALTHAHDVCSIGCYIYIMLCLAALNNKGLNKYDLFKNCLPCIEQEARRNADSNVVDLYSRIFDLDNFKNLPLDSISSSGYVLHSLEAALWCFLNTDNYHDCVITAVNLGEDTDTIAAIAGGLAGIYYGLDSIPKDWLADLRNKSIIEELCR